MNDQPAADVALLFVHSPEGDDDEEDEVEEEEDEERGETESYMVSTGSEKETFFFGVTVGVGAVFFMILGDEGVETVYVLPIKKEEERKCPFAVLGMMTSESRNRN